MTDTIAALDAIERKMLDGFHPNTHPIIHRFAQEVRAALAAEANREAEELDRQGAHPDSLSMRAALPLAAEADRATPLPRCSTAERLLRDHFVITEHTDPRVRIADNLTAAQFIEALVAVEGEAVDRWLASPDAVDVVARALQTPEVQDIAVHYEPDRAAAALIEAMLREMEEPR